MNSQSVTENKPFLIETEADVHLVREYAAEIAKCVIEHWDSDAYERLADYFRPRLMAKFAQWTHKAEAAELAADCLTDALVKVDKYKGPSSEGLANWLYSVARNRGIDYLRRTSRRIVECVPVEELNEEPQDEEQTHSIEGEDFRKIVELLWQAISDLRPKERRIISALYFEDKDAPEVAKSLGTTPANVRQLSRRVRQRLKSMLSENPYVCEWLNCGESVHRMAAEVPSLKAGSGSANPETPSGEDGGVKVVITFSGKLAYREKPRSARRNAPTPYNTRRESISKSEESNSEAEPQNKLGVHGA